MSKCHKLNVVLKIIILTFIMISVLFVNKANANQIASIIIDVFIEDDGDALFTETWDAELLSGTEGFRPYTNLGKSEISNFSVSDSNGNVYTEAKPWNVSGTFADKAYKYGINPISDGVELCWGISKYGNNQYILKYEIEDFVVQYTDTQGIYFNFLNLDQSIGNAVIRLRSNQQFSLENSKIWAFGNDGTIDFEDGGICIASEGLLSTSEYMVGLVRFESNLFNTQNISELSFDDIYESAMSTVEDEENESNFVKAYIAYIILMCMPYIMVFFILRIAFRGFGRRKNPSRYMNIDYRPLDFGKKINKRNVAYCREIPCDGDLYYAYWLISKYGILKPNECKNGLIGAMILKWIKEGYVEITKTKGGFFSLKDNKYAVHFNQLESENYKKKPGMEQQLMNMFRNASGENCILEANEFEKWCRDNHNYLNRWFDRVIDEATERMQQKQLIREERIIKKRLFKSKIIVKKYVEEKARTEVERLLGLKKFLLDYSLIPDRENEQVHLLEDYLIFAQLLGIADKVEEQFSRLYPDFKELSKINLENTSSYTISLSTSIVTTLIKETERYERILERERRREARRYSSYDYSGSDTDSGGGGDSYSSGGDSAGGSSGGGFR